MFIRWLYFKLAFLFFNYFGHLVPCIRIFHLRTLNDVELINGLKIYT